MASAFVMRLCRSLSNWGLFDVWVDYLCRVTIGIPSDYFGSTTRRPLKAGSSQSSYHARFRQDCRMSLVPRPERSLLHIGAMRDDRHALRHFLPRAA